MSERDYVHVKLRDPVEFERKSFRTLRVKSHRIVVGYLKGEQRVTRSGRPMLTAQAILHPAGEMLPGCPGCTRASGFLRKG